MNNVKKIIKENIPFVIIALTLIAIVITFSVMDYVNGKKIYRSGLQDQESVPYENKEYKENEYKVVNISKETMAMYYLREIIYEIHKEPKKLWEKIPAVDKEKKYNNSFKNFEKELNKIITSVSIRNTLKEYGIKNNDLNQTVYILMDNEYNSFKVVEKGVWDIEVTLLGKKRPDIKK